MGDPKGHPQNFTTVRPYMAEGARIGVATCLRCGASISIDPGDTFDVADLHDRWHEGLAAIDKEPEA